MDNKQILGQYFTEVLGVEYGFLMESEKSTLVERVDTTPSSFFQCELAHFANIALNQKFKVVFISQAGNTEYSTFQSNHYELFQKMRSAMKLQSIEAPLLEIQLGNEKIIPTFSSQCIVFFEEHVSLRSWSFHEGMPAIRVASPGYLFYHPAEKKEVWTRLQLVLERL
jgi:hypothetical protein